MSRFGVPAATIADGKDLPGDPIRIVSGRDAVYAQVVSGIYACLTPNNALDLALPNCKLQKPWHFGDWKAL